MIDEWVGGLGAPDSSIKALQMRRQFENPQIQSKKSKQNSLFQIFIKTMNKIFDVDVGSLFTFSSFPGTGLTKGAS